MSEMIVLEIVVLMLMGIAAITIDEYLIRTPAQIEAKYQERRRKDGNG